MVTTSRWNPLAEFEDILERYNRQLANRSQLGNGHREVLQKADWIPVVDISEDNDAFIIVSEIPGVRKEDVKVSVNNGVLTIQGERRPPEKAVDEEMRQHRIERAYGQFARSFTLPEHVDDEHIKASYRDGLLELRLAKQEKAKPRSIEVEVE
ncbi:MAG: Hsp20/alpha crystallin family protein [Halomonadaceae bacterium]|nr:MAG: Hsp20/alpha crystallin family protein [Halomonadaceae bacterium]